MGRVLFAGLLLSAHLLLPGAAYAEASPESVRRAQEHDAQATELFSAGDYQGAMAEMQAAQALLPSTVRLYNMAACQERLGHRPEAIDLYQRFLADPDAPAERLGAARTRVEQLRAELSSTAGGETNPPPPPDDPPDEGTGDDGQVAPPPTTPEPRPQPTSRRRLRPVAFWATLGSFVALGTGFAVAGGITLSRSSDLEGYQPGQDVDWLADLHYDAAEVESYRDTLYGVTTAFFVLTCAAATAAIVLAIFTNFHRDRQTSARRLQLTAGATDGGGALGLFGRF